MTHAEWTERFGEGFLFSLTSRERGFLALGPISPDWESIEYIKVDALMHSRTTVFFDGDTIVKVIEENMRVRDGGFIDYRQYTEYDTHLLTENRRMLLPLTGRGKPKKLSPAVISKIEPFGCALYIQLMPPESHEPGIHNPASPSTMTLVNPRANARFALGEYARITALHTAEDFRAFIEDYTASRPADHAQRIAAFRAAEKLSVKYKPGDIFRMDYDGTRCCYGVILASLKQLRAMPELPEEHSYRHRMGVPLLVRPYHLLTEDRDMTPDRLQGLPMGRAQIVMDNDIIWGTHPVVCHRPIEAAELEFPFVVIRRPGRKGAVSESDYTLYIEWGAASTQIHCSKLTSRLRGYFSGYSSPQNGAWVGIKPDYLLPDEHIKPLWAYRADLLNPENRELLDELLKCIGLRKDTSFDAFNAKFGGLSLQEMALRINSSK